MMPRLPEPVGRQREVLYLDAIGHTVVLGTAGSGKSTMAVLRARHLASDYLLNAGPTLLVTYNKALAANLRFRLEGESSDVTVSHFQQFAFDVFNRRGRDITGLGCLGFLKRELTVQAMADVERTWPAGEALFERDPVFVMAEIDWISENGVADEAEYVDVERTGRAGARLARASRPAMWAVRSRFVELRDGRGKLHHFSDLATQVRERLEADTGRRPFRHVVIDEGQDFSREMLRALAASIPAEGSLTFFGDYAQEVFGRRRSWRSAGLRVRGRIWEFRENYRNTHEIAQFAKAMTTLTPFDDVGESVAAGDPQRHGPLPALVRCSDEDEEIRRAASLAATSARSRSVAILFRRHEHFAQVRERFPDATRIDDRSPSLGDRPGITFGTYYSAKGLEFDQVILPICSEDRLPDPRLVEAYGLDEAGRMDVRPLYVAVTRAREELTILHTGPLTRLLPSDPSLYRGGEAEDS